MIRTTTVAAVVAAMLAAGGAASAGRTDARPQTLVSTKSRITRFAQDGEWVAWMTVDKRCAVRLHLFSIRRRKQDASARIYSPNGCYDDGFDALALASDRAAWTSLVGAGNTELDVAVSTFSAADPKPHRVREMAMIRESYSREPEAPPIAGRGRMLVYYRDEDGILGSPAHTVERVLGSRPKRVFSLNDPVALAVDRGRIASVQRVLVQGDACNCNFDPVWSPDGTRLAYVSGERCCFDYDESVDVYVENADGSGRMRITTDGRPKLGVAWSPDGTRLAYGYFDAAFFRRLAVVNVDGTGGHDLADGENPSWSPDGTKLAYDDGADHVLVAGADGSGAQVIAAGSRPAWSPDGTRIAYDDGDNQISTVRPDGTDRRLVAIGMKEPAWSPDGGTIAGASADGISVVQSGSTSPRWLPGTDRGDGDASWSPDGSRILFDSLRNDLDRDENAEPELYVMGAAGGDVKAVNYSTAAEWTGPLEIRDGTGRILAGTHVSGEPLGLALAGKYAAVLGQPARSSDRFLWVVDARTARLLRILRVPSIAGSISASDGRAVFAAGRTIRLVDLASGRVRLLASARGPIVGVAISSRRVTWAEIDGKRGRVRTLLLPR